MSDEKEGKFCRLNVFQGFPIHWHDSKEDQLRIKRRKRNGLALLKPSQMLIDEARGRKRGKNAK